MLVLLCFKFLAIIYLVKFVIPFDLLKNLVFVLCHCHRVEFMGCIDASLSLIVMLAVCYFQFHLLKSFNYCCRISGFLMIFIIHVGLILDLCRLFIDTFHSYFQCF